MEIGATRRALLDAPHCGDQYGYWHADGTTLLCMVDGLGHGKDAEIAAKAAVEYVGEHRTEPLRDILVGCDSELRYTRGVAMGIALVDGQFGKIQFAGVGNTRARVVTGRNRKSFHMTSAYGIVGAGIRSVVAEVFDIVSGDLVIMYTDGLKEVFDISGYDAALFLDVQRLAERILLDWNRTTDDAAVLVFRNTEA